MFSRLFNRLGLFAVPFFALALAGCSGQTGAGKVAAQQLESSTVDLSAEFTGLITTQRAYSANTKVISTADQMMQELLQLR